MATSLDTPLDTLVATALSVLNGLGYSYNNLTTSLEAYLAVALTGIGGSNVSNLNLQRTELLAGLVNALSAGPVSHLTTTEAVLWALLAGASGGGSFTPSLDFSDDRNSQYTSII